ncbi:hypothetical protein [Pseudactinotalea terrae]|uniref:hypothetical protein n=1 Tax=Pseudactinotalea terrae TaxID=1743262 RepID=UPI0012E24EC4|nr:hypothetical protein [Pseudactinotalea terrae]
MTLCAAIEPAVLLAAQALDAYDAMGYFAVKNRAGITDLIETAEVAVLAAREVGVGRSDTELGTDPGCLTAAAIALAEREGSDAFATCDIDSMHAYRTDARIILRALS